MITQILRIQDPEAIAKARRLIGQELVIAAPTDTVYGLMCRFDSVNAIERIYIAKDRPPYKPIPVLLADDEQLPLLVTRPWPHHARLLMKLFWPGPLTLVLPARSELPAILTAGQPTVAVRMPLHDELRKIMRESGPLAATSANLSGLPDAHFAAEVLAQLDGRIPLLLTDDEVADRRKTKRPSTIVDLTVDPPQILRPGPLEHAVRAALEETAPRAGHRERSS